MLQEFFQILWIKFYSFCSGIHVWFYTLKVDTHLSYFIIKVGREPFVVADTEGRIVVDANRSWTVRAIVAVIATTTSSTEGVDRLLGPLIQISC